MIYTVRLLMILGFRSCFNLVLTYMVVWKLTAYFTTDTRNPVPDISNQVPLRCCRYNMSFLGTE